MDLGRVNEFLSEAVEELSEAYKINNREREMWIDNDEGLYDWWRSSRLSKREFIKQNKAEIDAAIQAVVSGKKRQHHLKYG